MSTVTDASPATESTSAAADVGSLIGTEADQIRARRDQLLGAVPDMSPDRSADDPVTGPMPAVSFLDGRIRTHNRRGVVVVELDGGLDLAMATEVAAALDGIVGCSGADAVILDLDQVTLLDQEGMDVLAAALRRAAGDLDSCMVASRLSGRLVLERWGFTADHVVFTSTADALQARAFASTGYGPGWVPA